MVGGSVWIWMKEQLILVRWGPKNFQHLKPAHYVQAYTKNILHYTTNSPTKTPVELKDNFEIHAFSDHSGSWLD